MEVSRKTVREILSRIRARLRGNDTTQEYPGDEMPLRSELFSADQMEQHGKVLASMHQLKSGRPRDRILARLADNESLLLEVHNLLTEDVKTDRRITPAGEWLLDNFYLIEEQIRTAKRHLPKGYSRELPHLVNGALAEVPQGIRHRSGNDLARRWTGISGKPQQVHSCLPVGDPSGIGRTVGHSYHAAPGPDREYPAGCRPDRGLQDRSKPCRILGRPDDGHRRQGPQEPDSDDCRYGTVESPDGELVYCGVHAPFAGPWSRSGISPDLA